MTNREVIPCEALDARHPESAALGAIKYWAFDNDGHDSISLARIRGILLALDPDAGLPLSERLAKSAARTIEASA